MIGPANFSMCEGDDVDMYHGHSFGVICVQGVTAFPPPLLCAYGVDEGRGCGTFQIILCSRKSFR